MSKLLDHVQELIEAGQEIDLLLKSQKEDQIHFSWITSFEPSELMAKQKQQDAGYLHLGHGFSNYRVHSCFSGVWSSAWSCMASCD